MNPDQIQPAGPEIETDAWRRAFLKYMAGGAAAATLMPFGARAEAASSAAENEPLTPSATDLTGEAYWGAVKAQFPLRPDLILLNAANLCPSPMPVYRAVFDLTADIDRDASFQNRAKFSQSQSESRALLAAYLGADSEEIALVRNTSEANNMVMNGLVFSAGDEIVIWDQNHPSNNVAWDVRAARYGLTVKRVATPKNPASPEELIAPFRGALSARTKLISITHVSNVSGVALPAREICALAAERGVLSLVDGAQTFGSQVVDLHDLGCDFYTGSGHKWFLGPKETGVLYVRRERSAALWPSVVTLGWEKIAEAGAQRFDNLGQRDDARVAAVGTTVKYHNAIGPARVEARIRALASRLRDGLSQALPNGKFVTPAQPELSAGIIIFQPGEIDARATMTALYQNHGVACAVFPTSPPAIRLCPHIYNTMAEMDRTIDAVTRVVS